jgi:hypothetical protein
MAKHRKSEITTVEKLVAHFFTAVLHFIGITAVGLPSILFFEAFRSFFETGFETVHTAVITLL